MATSPSWSRTSRGVCLGDPRGDTSFCSGSSARTRSRTSGRMSAVAVCLVIRRSSVTLTEIEGTDDFRAEASWE